MAALVGCGACVSGSSCAGPTVPGWGRRAHDAQAAASTKSAAPGRRCLGELTRSVVRGRSARRAASPKGVRLSRSLPTSAGHAGALARAVWQHDREVRALATSRGRDRAPEAEWRRVQSDTEHPRASSTRRFRARPSSVAFDSRGRVAPRPSVSRRGASTPCSCTGAARTPSARAAESDWFAAGSARPLERPFDRRRALRRVLRQVDAHGLEGACRARRWGEQPSPRRSRPPRRRESRGCGARRRRRARATWRSSRATPAAHPRRKRRSAEPARQGRCGSRTADTSSRACATRRSAGGSATRTSRRRGSGPSPRGGSRGRRAERGHEHETAHEREGDVAAGPQSRSRATFTSLSASGSVALDVRYTTVSILSPFRK